VGFLERWKTAGLGGRCAVDDFVASVVGCQCCALISFDDWQQAMQVVLRE
jgi:hypothetical protein